MKKTCPSCITKTNKVLSLVDAQVNFPEISKDLELLRIYLLSFLSAVTQKSSFDLWQFGCIFVDLHLFRMFTLRRVIHSEKNWFLNGSSEGSLVLLVVGNSVKLGLKFLIILIYKTSEKCLTEVQTYISNMPASVGEQTYSVL